MNAPERPLPDLENPLHAEFWRNAAAGRLTMQACDQCGYVRWPPEPICPACLAASATWREVSGKGAIWSLAVYEHAYHPAFREELPYTVILVELDEGPRMISRIVARDAAEAQVGLRVSAVFEEVAENVSLVYFERDDSPSG